MAKKKPTRKKSNQSNTSLARRQRALKRLQLNKEQNQKTDLTVWGKIVRYKKLIPVGAFFGLIGIYSSYYPKNIILDNKLLGSEFPLSDAIIVINPNPYELTDVQIKSYANADFTLLNGQNISDNKVSNNYTFYTLKSKSSRHIKGSYAYIGSNISELRYSEIRFILSYKTPFLYPNITNDTISFIGVLNSDKEVIYLPK